MGYASLRFLLPKEDMNMDKISVIVPCYNEEEVLPLFHKEVTKELETIENIDYEILFIDDGSHDHTIDLLKMICAKDHHCDYYSFSRNFGKEAAMFAGLKNQPVIIV